MAKQWYQAVLRMPAKTKVRMFPQTTMMTFLTIFFADDQPSTGNTAVLEIAASSIAAQTAAEIVDTENIDTELSTVEKDVLSVASSVTQSISTLIKNTFASLLNIGKGAENANENENKDVPTKDKDEETSESPAVFHSIDTSAIDNATATSSMDVDAETEKNENKVPIDDDGDEKAQDSSIDIQSIDNVAAISNIVVETGADSQSNIKGKHVHV